MARLTRQILGLLFDVADHSTTKRKKLKTPEKSVYDANTEYFQRQADYQMTPPKARIYDPDLE